jgi:hypothetical protein
MIESQGYLGAVIWPSFVGVCTQDPGAGLVAYGEPEDVSYSRGGIVWGIEDEQITGRAFVNVPAGTYTHLAYFHGPEGPRMGGKMQLAHPLVFPKDGVLEVYPITNPNLELNTKQGCQ